LMQQPGWAARRDFSPSKESICCFGVALKPAANPPHNSEASVRLVRAISALKKPKNDPAGGTHEINCELWRIE
jgi:hypothetical protein